MGETQTLLKVREVADMLNLAESTVYSFANSGILPAIKLGRAVRFDRKAVESAVQKMADATYGK